jgi:hypothetical protein
LDYRKRERKRGSFEARVNNLFQEGIKLSDDVAPAIPSDATEIPLFAEPAHIDRAVEFMGRVQGLLRDERPWLLPVYQETWTAEREKHKEHEAKREKSRGELPNALKLRNFAEETHGVPQRVVERTLTALAAAKRQDGGR